MRTLLVFFAMSAVASTAAAQDQTIELTSAAVLQHLLTSTDEISQQASFAAPALEVANASSARSVFTSTGEPVSDALDALAGGDIVFPAQDPAEKPPIPAHTGIKALFFETASDFALFPQRKSTWIILALGGATALAAHPADDNVNARLAGSANADRFFKPGQYLGGYAQAGAAVSLYLVGRFILPHTKEEPRTNKVSHLGFDMLRALILSQAVTQGIKVSVRRDRPTGECCSFPSGHAASTFATASVLERHLGYRASWPMFLIATYVATSRLHDNRHFLSDVVFGASVGMASGWTVVGRHGRSNYALVPVAVPGGAMVMLTHHG
ncbi:MAG TPA: phosphatase PAP2 family protein [Vicinamibacterales bacterium]|jgi:membrane-associated phospholipid phosphatase|nr:phosphatase PAP2 family protein [Vicinamibacterales bacterium]